MDKQHFREKALEYFRANYPELGFVLHEDEFALTTGEGHIVYLITPYTNFSKNNFLDLEKVLHEYWRHNKESAQAIEYPWEQIEHLVLPQIKTQAQLDVFEQSQPDLYEDWPVAKPFIGELRELWVIDQPKGFIYITKKALEGYNKSLDILSLTASTNLEKLPGTTDGLQTINMTKGGVSFMWETNDGYDAARLLLPNFNTLFRQQLGESFLVGIPHRDVLLAMPLQYQESLTGFVAEQFDKSPHPILNIPLACTPDGFRVLK